MHHNLRPTNPKLALLSAFHVVAGRGVDEAGFAVYVGVSKWKCVGRYGRERGVRSSNKLAYCSAARRRIVKLVRYARGAFG
jgi:hypothetical protein